jgi:hypothetical protein
MCSAKVCGPFSAGATDHGRNATLGNTAACLQKAPLLDRPHHSEDPERLLSKASRMCSRCGVILARPSKCKSSRCRMRYQSRGTCLVESDPFVSASPFPFPGANQRRRANGKDPTKRQGPSKTLQDLPARFSGVKQTYFRSPESGDEKATRIGSRRKRHQY